MDLKPTFEHYYPENTFGGECAAFAEKLVQFGPVGDSYASKLAYFKKHGSTNLSDTQVGDVLLTNDSLINGHIFVVNCDMGDSWRATESNFALDHRVHHTRLVKKNSPHLKAHLRGKIKVTIINPMPIHKFLVLLSHVEETATLASAIEDIRGRIAGLGDIRIEITYFPTDFAFHTVNTPGFLTPIYANPDEIGVEGHRAELELKKEFDSVCLVYDPSLVIGPQPTNPVENPLTIEGFNIFSIPTNWFGTSFDSCRLYFYHEMLHSWYYIINKENPTIGIPDLVHSYVPPSGPGEATLEANLEYYDSLVLQLKPYWPSLANDGATGTGDPMLTYKFTDNATEFILTDDATLIPMTAVGLTKVLAGRPEKLIMLAPSERAKYKIVTAVVN